MNRWIGMPLVLAKMALALLLAKIIDLFSGNKRIWLIAERPDEARDNGYHFFKYVRTHRPARKAYYVIAPNAADRVRVAGLGQVIDWGSFHHYLCWCMADCLISAHPGECAPEPNLSWRVKKAGLIAHASVNLQHGVTAINRADFWNKKQRYDLVATTAEPERDYLQAIMQQQEGVIQILGFCRYDALYVPMQKRRQVLLMPTWRRWFRGLVAKMGKTAALTAFRESEYFQAFNAILTSERLRSALKEMDYYLAFYPHYGIQELLDAFSCPHERVTIAARHQYDVQQLLRESSILVTDFSSVSFDFAYLRKPVIYFLPDEERYFAEHFGRGYFDLDRDGFGPVTRDADAAVAALEKMMRNQDVDASVYKRRAERFFAFRDNRNCERTMAAIEEVMARRSRGA